MENRDLAVEVKGLTKKFGQLTAVDNISFDVKRGEFFGFLGPNGAGKTTTARILTGVIQKTGGETKVMGYPAGSFGAKQQSGVMPEVSNAYLDLTAWDNIMLVAELYRLPKVKAVERASALMEQLGLLDRKDSLAKTYSMGMRKRLVLCMALIPDPDILFLDEPTSGLDVQSVRFMRSLLRSLKQQGKTIFFTTHNMDEAAEMCDRVAIINHGKIVAMDSPDNLSITAGRVYLVDVSFETPDFKRPVGTDDLLKLPGVSRVESAQAIEEAEKLRTQQAMAAMRGQMQGNGGMAPTPEMMRRMQQQMQAGGGPSPEMMKKMQESGGQSPEMTQKMQPGGGTHVDMAAMRKLVQEDGGPTPEMRALMAQVMQEGGPTPERTAEMMKLIEKRRQAQAGGGSTPGATPQPGKTPGGGGAKKPESNRFRLYTENTTLLVTSLVDFSRANAVKMNILNVRSPSLEDAFVRLTEEKSREK